MQISIVGFVLLQPSELSRTTKQVTTNSPPADLSAKLFGGSVFNVGGRHPGKSGKIPISGVSRYTAPLWIAGDMKHKMQNSKWYECGRCAIFHFAF
jgi:hypothetical protein